MAIDDFNPQIADTPVEPFEEGSGNSVIDLIRQEMDELSAHRDVFIPIKGYEKTGLAVRYGMPEKGKELDDIANKNRRVDKDDWYLNLHTAMDTMIHLCLGIYIRPEGVEDYVELDPNFQGAPVRFDHQMANIVGLPENSNARQVIRKLFDNNDMKILDHSSRLQRWLSDNKADVEKELWQLGN